MGIQGEQIGTAVLVLTTDSTGLDQGIAQAKQKATRGVADLARIGRSAANLGKSMSVAVTAPLLALGTFAVKAYGEQQEAEAKLQKAIENSGHMADISISNLNRFAEEVQKATTYEDDAVVAAMARIESLAGVGEGTLQTLAKAATDMATGLGIDLETAATAIGKTVSGASDALGRYGIEVDKKVTDPTLRAIAVSTQLEGKFGGMSEAAAKVGLGPIEQFKNTASAVGEQFGSIILPRLTELLDKVKGLLEWFGNLNPKVQEFLVTFASIAAVTGPGLLFLGKIMEAGPAIVTAVQGISGAFGGLATAIGGLVGGGGGAAMAGLVGGPFGLAIVGFAALAGKAKDLATSIADWITFDAAPKIEAFVKSVAQWFSDLAGKIADAISKIVGALRDWVEARLDGFKSRIKDWADKVGGFFVGLYDKLVGHSVIPDMVLAIEKWFDRLGESMTSKSQKAVDEAKSIYGELTPEMFAFNEGMANPASTGGGGRAPSSSGGGGGAPAWLQSIGSVLQQLAQQFVQLILSTYAFTSFLDSVTQKIAPIAEMMAMQLVAAITPLVPVFTQLVQNLSGPVMGVFAMLATFIQQTMPAWNALASAVGAIAQVIGEALAPVFAALAPVVNALAPVFALIGTIFKDLSPVFQFVGKVVTVLAATIGWLIGKAAALGTTIWYIVSGQWDKIGTVGWGGTLADAIDSAMAGISAYAAGANTSGQTYTVTGAGAADNPKGGTAGAGRGGGTIGANGGGDAGGTTYGGGATYEQARPITVSINIGGNTIAGDGSFRALALAIKRELDSIDALGLV